MLMVPLEVVEMPPMVTLSAFTVAPFLMLSVAWPPLPMASSFVIVQFEFVSCMLTVLLDVALKPMIALFAFTVAPFLMLSDA